MAEKLSSELINNISSLAFHDKSHIT
ncbi:MAG: hypothetical protein RJB62_623, partial [Pseudomonadota bacterium]